MCVLLLAAAQFCGGCGASVEPIYVASGCPGQPLRGPEAYANEPANQLIDDFESGDADLPSPSVEGRDGQWVLGSDQSSDSSIHEVSSHCAARGKWAGHFAASGFANWGLNWTAVFRATLKTAVPYDGSAYNAISFFASLSQGSGDALDVPVGLTTMDNAWNSNGCSPCMDFYAAKVRLSQNWQRFVIPFDQMKQRGTGAPQVAMRRDQLVGFIIWPQQAFDIWIDDVRFER